MKPKIEDFFRPFLPILKKTSKKAKKQAFCHIYDYFISIKNIFLIFFGVFKILRLSEKLNCFVLYDF